MRELPTHPLLHQIATAEEVPAEAIVRCMLCIPQVAPELLAAIARTAEAEAAVASQSDLNLVYYGVHILAAAREQRLQAPLLRLLRLPDETLDKLLGNDYPGTLPKLAIGAFNGDFQALFDLLCDAGATEFVRRSLFGAVAYLTWLGRIPAETTRALLSRFDTDRAIPARDIGWNGWESAIELLGWDAFAPLVEAAYADGRLDTGISELRLFRQGLAAAAEAASGDDQRFAKVGYGYIEDLLEAVAVGAPLLQDPDDEPDEREEMMRWAADAAQRRNPLRHVGRNDPCPCGSGKKYKRCCLAP